MINLISIANEILYKVDEFLTHEKVMKILENKRFAVKIKIPLTFLHDIDITFTNFIEIDVMDNTKLFEIPLNYQEKRLKILKITIKRGQFTIIFILVDFKYLIDYVNFNDTYFKKI